MLIAPGLGWPHDARYSFSRHYAGLRLAHRATPQPDGHISYRLADGSGYVRLDPDELDQILTYFRQQTRRSYVTAQVGLVLCVPAFVLLCIFLNAPPIKFLWMQLGMKQVVQWGTLAALPGFPVAVYLWLSRVVERVEKAIEVELSSRGRVRTPRRAKKRLPIGIDIAIALLAGPHLVFAVVGSLSPTTFDNTPLSGTHIDLFAIAAFALIAFRLVWPRIAARRAR